MRMLLSLSLIAFFATVSVYLAKKRGRDPIAWCLIAIAFPIFAPILLLILPNRKNLPIEDLEEDEEQKLIKYYEESSKNTDVDDKVWFYLDVSHQQKGPLGLEALKAAWERGKISDHSFVWTEGMASWQRVEEVSELKKLQG